jgi:DinB superfamily
VTEQRRAVRAELELARAEFHEVRRSLSERDWRARSLNPGWTNGEIMFHAAFGFMIVSRLAPMVRFWSRLPPGFSSLFADILNLLTPVFNVVNALGARGGSRYYSRGRIGQRFDREVASILDLLTKLPDDEWSAGMYYPTRWDGLFTEYMTLSDVFRYPVKHFRFHASQLSRATRPA